MEQLKCSCNTNENHVPYVDRNKETVVECTQCKEFIKFPEGVEYAVNTLPAEEQAEESLPSKKKKKGN